VYELVAINNKEPNSIIFVNHKTLTLKYNCTVTWSVLLYQEIYEFVIFKVFSHIPGIYFSRNIRKLFSLYFQFILCPHSYCVCNIEMVSRFTWVEHM